MKVLDFKKRFSTICEEFCGFYKRGNLSSLAHHGSNAGVLVYLLVIKGNKIGSFWTSDGRVYVKKKSTSDPIRVSMSDSISAKLNLKRSMGQKVQQTPPRLKSLWLSKNTINRSLKLHSFEHCW